MPVQTTYLDNIRPGLPGAQADMTPSSVISRDVEGATGIKFGAAVMRGVAERGALPAGAGGVFTAARYLGFALRDRSAVGTVENGFAERESARIMTHGTLWATPAQNVVAGDPVYVRPSNGDIQKDNTNSAVLIPGAVWDTTATAGAGVVAIIRLT